MNAAALDYGTVPAWAAVLFTAVSCTLTWFATRGAYKDRKRKASEELRSAARKVTITPSRIADTDVADKLQVTATARNDGDLPITRVWVFVLSKRLVEEACTAERYLNPGQELELREVADAVPDPFPLDGNDDLLTMVTFVDADGYHWQRWADGTLTPAIDGRPSTNPVVRWIVRLKPIGYFVMKWRKRKNRPPLQVKRPGAR